jgi:hypothetical protein
MSHPTRKLPNKMMLGFVVRRCAAALGHHPTAEEFAAWANNQRDGRLFNLFGRPISVGEARLILGHPGRPVTTRDASSRPPATASATGQVTSLASALARLPQRPKARKR